jgi:Cu/Ag efflux protein CusF
MKLRLLFLVSLLLAPLSALAATAKNCGCECCKGKEVCCCADDESATAAEPELAAGFHRLTGVVTNVMADRSALMVKHDEIPGFMRAMTMMFLVEPAVLEQVKKGDAIAAHMGRNADNKWILRHVRVVPPQR